MKKEITILIPTFNRSELLNRSLSSLGLQDERIFIHCVISDNFSQDETKEVVNSWINRKSNLKITYIKHDSDIRPLDNWMSMLGYIDTEYSKFLFDDDWLKGNALNQMLNDITKLKAKSIIYNTNIYAKTHNYDPIVDYYKHNDKKLTTEIVINSILRIENALPVTPSAAVQTSDSLSEALLFSEINSDCSEKVIGNDLIMNFFPLFQGCNSYFINKSIVNLWGGEDSITVNTTNGKILNFCYIKSLVYLLEKFYCETTINQSKKINHKIFANNIRSLINSEYVKFNDSNKFKPRPSIKEVSRYLLNKTFQN